MDPHPDFKVRFVLDSFKEAVNTNELLAWPAFDVQAQKPVWLLGRRIGDKVLPLAQLLPDSTAAIRRYAPAIAPDEYDFSLTETS